MKSSKKDQIDKQVENFLKNSTYLGNKQLKPAGINVPFNEDHIKEIARCSQDPIYFIKKYVKIITIDDGEILFDLRDYQEEIVNLYHNNNRVITKICRQAGKTETTAAYILHYIIFNDDKTAAMLAHKAQTAREILSRIKTAYMLLPKWMQHGIIEWNKGSIVLENGSRIIASATSADAIRGYTIGLLYLDEFAHVPGNIAVEFFSSVYPTVSSGTTSKIFITSTPKGIGNLFYKTWKAAEDGKNKYKTLEVHWSQVPGRDEQWKQDQIEELGEQLFKQENECLFLGSADTLISSDALMALQEIDPISEKNSLRIFKEPIKGHTYVMTVDVAEGGGNDNSAISVIDITNDPYEQVATYRNNKISIMAYPDVIFNVGKAYNDAWALIEYNSVGSTVAYILKQELEYENMFETIQMGRAGQVLTLAGNKANIAGLKTTPASKRKGCSYIKTIVEKGNLIINDDETIFEAQTFIYDGANYSAEEGCNDDMMMTLVLFGWLNSQEAYRSFLEKDLRKTIMRTDLEEIDQDLIPFDMFSSNESLEEDDSFLDDEGTRWHVAGTYEVW